MSQDKVSLLRDPTAGVSTSSDSRNYDSVDPPPHTENRAQISFVPRRLPQYVAALTATLSALAAGAVLGWTSPILSDLQHGKFHNISVTSDQMGWIGSFVTLGGMTMCIPTGFLCDLLGRKKTLLLLIAPFAVGWSLIIFAKSIIMLYLGRLITGMAAGASCVAAPLYTSEIAQKEIRGTLGSYFQLMVTVGIFLAYLSGKYLTSMPYTIFCACLPVVFVVLFAFQPETPAFCLRRGRYDDALKALVKLRGPCEGNESELAEIEGSLKESLESSVSFSQTFRKKANVKALVIAFALMFFQQFSGINAVILYTSDIFASAGSNLDANTAAIIVGAFQVVATFVSSLVIDKLGRKILLFTSAVVMALSSLVLAIYFTLKCRTSIDGDILHELGFIPIVSLCLFVVVFSIGLGPIPWMISSEIFTPEIKSIASSSAGTFNWFLAFLVTKFYLQVNERVGQDSTFYAFAVLSLLGGAFVYFVIPETKGKTVEQVQAELER
ncbi:facilitated trehalose transporter Tret1 [Tribolium castaneum]|uniref:Facilitated trehalose transporter Tret1-2 homolog-like Protein n=1 Tax=Tribolium castaneum TaxID=7070 RepID=A0A139WD56_TRICA|nr:PREDICTED: facilitated trehalose transporter Tret1-like [Tribolium castaneum]KYB25889.1 Facilitated trehalose transporter Tret1-2 homolog-like Protein [Tribolium castaneum]|eukprot:XP_008197154.2 PREDICTED: facilitated trehalose transporter Tret1-like [Tribolium castaneum]